MFINTRVTSLLNRIKTEDKGSVGIIRIISVSKIMSVMMVMMSMLMEVMLRRAGVEPSMIIIGTNTLVAEWATILIDKWVRGNDFSQGIISIS